MSSNNVNHIYTNVSHHWTHEVNVEKRLSPVTREWEAMICIGSDKGWALKMAPESAAMLIAELARAIVIASELPLSEARLVNASNQPAAERGES